MLRRGLRWAQPKPRMARPALRVAAHRPLLERLEDRALPSFVAAPTYAVSTGGKPVAVVTGDFNRDGKIDCVTANQGSNNLSFLAGKGNGTFGTATTILLGKSPTALIAVDLNGDGRLDLVTANKDDNSISVLLGTGAGTFQTPITIAVGSKPVALAWGDFNGDHHVDLAIADNGADAVTILMGNGNGHFTVAGNIAVGTQPTSVAVADFNGDGLDDVASVSGSFGHLDVNLNHGDGTFFAPVNYPTGFCANSVAVGDFNHDGRPDLAVACTFPSGDGVSVLLGNPDGTFQTFAKYDVGGQNPSTLAVGDLTGNGVQDIVTANSQFANNSVSVLMGNGNGTFGSSSVYTAGQSPDAVALGDFNGDGILDVVAADTAGPIGCVSVLLGNGDGTLLASPDLVLNSPGPSVQADFTGDNITDLAVVTSNTDFSGVTIFPGLGNGLFGSPLQTVTIDQPTSVAVGDFNHDQKMDLAVSTAAGVTVLLGAGNGSFGTRYDFAAGPTPTWIAVDDFNGDTFPDIVVADNNQTGGGVSLLLGNGDGTFAPAVSISAGGPAKYVVTGDFNGDHAEDLAAVDGSNNNVDVLLGDGHGNFGAPTAYATRNGPGLVGVGDFNNDHHLDLALPTFFGPDANSALTVLLNKGAGTFALSKEYANGSLPTGIAVTDLTGDQKLDVATANQFADNVYVFPGTGIGTLGDPTIYAVGDRPKWLTAADFNNDGHADLAVVNSNAGTITLLETPQTAAARFRVTTVQSSATAGTSITVIVSAYDSANRLMTGYSGTVSFTSSDGHAALPVTYRFTAADQGVHRFTLTLKTAASQSIVAHSGVANGSDSITVAPTKANHLQVTAGPATAGSPFDVTVTALDPYNNVATSFLGTVHFSSNDSNKSVSLPADYPFVAGDQGVHAFSTSATLFTAGTRTLTVTDPPVVGPSGSTSVTVQAADASQLFITSAPITATAGIAAAVTVTAKDPYNNIAAGFTGTVHFTSSDNTADLPLDYQFLDTENGSHTFKTVMFKAAGPQSLTVSATNCSDGQDPSIVVKPGAAAQTAFVGQPANTFMATAIKPFVTVQIKDAFGNLVGAGVPVTLVLSNNPNMAGLGGASAMTNASGIATFTAVAVSKAGVGYTLVAHSGAGTSTPSAAFTVYAATHFSVIASTTTSQAGSSFTITVTALDSLNHQDPTYVGTVHFSSTSSPLAVLQGDYTFQPSDNGQQTFTVMLNRAGVQSVTATDTLKSTVKRSANVTITPGPMSGFLVTGLPKATHNLAYSFTVTAVDSYGNTIPDYLGVVQFSNTGGTAILPTPYQFMPLDKGKRTFKATLQSLGANQSLMVTDQDNSSYTGTENGIDVV
jgi:hypothetical protein